MLALDDEQACRVLGTPLAQFAHCDSGLSDDQRASARTAAS
jgi:hypothetical protein